VRRSSSPELGSYVLELAGVVMGVAICIVGAADITRVFQARSAVRAAVNDGARCLFPTDAACVAGAPGEVSTTRRGYDVWVWGSGYEVPQESYVVSARANYEPVYEVSVLRDEIVDVTVERERYQYRPYSMRYPTTAHTTYLLQTRFLPIVVGGTPLDPLLAEPLTLKPSPPTATYALENVKGTTTKRVSAATATAYHDTFGIGSVSFPMRDAWPTAVRDRKEIASMPAGVQSALPCLFGTRRASAAGDALDWSAGTPQACRYRVRSARSSPVMSEGTLKIPLMFRVEGNSRGTAEGGQGKVMMALSWRSPSAGTGTFQLGGRRIEHWGGGNFIPRGLAEADINEDLRSQYEHYMDELSLYHEIPLLPVDATVTIDFYLVSFNNQRVAWNGGKLEVWLPQYRLVHEQSDCGYTSNPSTCARPPKKAPVDYVSLTKGASFSAVVTGEDTCSSTQSQTVERDLSATLARLQTDASQGRSMRPYSFNLLVPTSKAVCAPSVETKPCQGALPEYYEGCAVSTTLKDIAGRCGVTSPDMKVTAYTKRPTTIGVKRVKACSEQPLPVCALPQARSVDSLPYRGASSCDAASTTDFPQMVLGPFNVTTCGSREEEVRRLYQTREKISQDATISLVTLPSSPVFSAEPPTGGCAVYSEAQGGTRELLCGRGLSEVEAERCCAESAGRCRKQSVIVGADASGEQARLSILSAAQRRVVEAVRAGYPPAVYQPVCEASEHNCLEVAASLEQNDSQAVVSAKVNVPLRLFGLFQNESTIVQHSTTRVLERTTLG
jgi:hypothetical protein